MRPPPGCRMIPPTMNAVRPNPWLLPLFLLALLAATTACSSTPKPPPSPQTRGGWEPAPVLDAGQVAGKRILVTSEDPARSNLGPRLARALTDELAPKGYVPATSAAEADFLCVLVIRYCGRAAPPDGHLDVLAAASPEPVLGGDESWLAADGSGYDTVTRKSKTLRFKSRARGWFGELWSGHEDDEWVMIVDVAVGARRADQRAVVQRHEGRAWAATVDYEMDKAAATTLMFAELKTRLPEAFP